MSETLSIPTPDAAPKPKAERKVQVKLLHDVWIANPDVESGIERIRTNIPVLDENGNMTVDPKSKALVTTQSIVDLPVSVAKLMIDQGKAVRMDPL